MNSCTVSPSGLVKSTNCGSDRVTWSRDHMDSSKSLIPSSTGLEIFSRTFYSYAGILSYLARGRFDLSDLFHDGPNYLAPPGPWLSLN